jgi:hypothetical protein
MYFEDFKSKLWMWGPFLGFGFAVLALLLFLVPSLFDLERGEPKVAYPYGTPDQLTLPGELRSAYLAANGGRSSLLELQSMRSSGVLETGGERAPFTSIKKRPWQSRLNLRFHNYELSFAVDGDTVWQRLTPRAQEPVVELKEGREADQIRQLGAFFDPVMMLFLLGEGQILRVEAGHWNDRSAMVLEFENRDLNLRATAYIHPQNMHLLARMDQLPNGDKRLLVYSDHRKVQGLIEPFIVESRIGGEFDNRVKVERMEPNIGTFSSFFQYPGD